MAAARRSPPLRPPSALPDRRVNASTASGEVWSSGLARRLGRSHPRCGGAGRVGVVRVGRPLRTVWPSGVPRALATTNLQSRRLYQPLGLVDVGQQAGEFHPPPVDVNRARAGEARAGVPEEPSGLLKSAGHSVEVRVADARSGIEQRRAGLDHVPRQLGGSERPHQLGPARGAPQPPSEERRQQDRADDTPARGRWLVRTGPARHSRPVNSRTTRIRTTTPSPPLG